MKHPVDRMAFAGGGVVRLSNLGSDGSELKEFANRADAGILPVWQGKPLVTAANSLCWLTRSHPCLSQVSEDPVCLGLWDDSPRFAADISAWSPDSSHSIEVDSILDGTEQQHPDAPEGARFVNLRSMMTTLANAEAELAAIAKSLLSWHARHRFCANCGSASRIAAAGWQRKCERCSTIHFCRTDPVVIMLITSGNSLLLGRAHGWPDRMHSLLAGYMEPGETVEAAVRRETFEETGIRVGQVSYVASQPWPFPSSLMLGCKGAAETTEITMDESELDNALWMTREEVLQTYADSSGPVAPPRPGSIAEQLIWLWLSGRLA